MFLSLPILKIIFFLFLSSSFLIFPKTQIGLFAWIVFVLPLILSSKQMRVFCSAKSVFVWSFFGFLVSGFFVFGWIFPTFDAAKVSKILAGISCILLSAYCAFYGSLFFVLWYKLSSKISNVFLPVLAIALWVFLEYVRAHFFSGFPWLLLGYSQVQFLPLLSIAQVTGVYGVSALVIAGNIFFAQSLRLKKIDWSSFLILISLVFFSLFFYFKPAQKTGEVSVALLQGNIDQYKKWDHAHVREILQTYKSLVAQTKEKTELVIWPESALPTWFPNDLAIKDWTQNVVISSKKYHLIGAVTQDQNQNFNSAFLLDKQGRIVCRYDKNHLVPFGEYVPLKNLWQDWIPILGALGGFESGQNLEPLSMQNRKISVNVCYEAIFPDLLRRQVLAGGEMLVNLTNDGWYLQTAAPHQHFAMNILRAVENQRCLVRVANTGISAVIRADGSIQAQTTLAQKTVLEQSVALHNNITFYSRYGDIFAKICLGISFIALLFLML